MDLYPAYDQWLWHSHHPSNIFLSFNRSVYNSFVWVVALGSVLIQGVIVSYQIHQLKSARHQANVQIIQYIRSNRGNYSLIASDA